MPVLPLLRALPRLQPLMRVAVRRQLTYVARGSPHGVDMLRRVPVAPEPQPQPQPLPQPQKEAEKEKEAAGDALQLPAV